ncbi:hypothetical protein RND71_011953 [Anisodus tanguticus]|uniref:RNase H type-1 domain-containing protein n=1 Tax=Anisodus tanguticus TaxID=243964 RepID=A0AAE1SEC7_9SOLA|nr:hypothetical protein RND71_011953 [Anisodus tanguticus]
MAAMDSCGYLLHALSNPIQFVGKVIIAKVLVIRHAFEGALQNGWSRIHILSDAKNVVQMLQKKMTLS